MPEVQTDHSETAELSKPQLRMVDLNLLTVFDAVMQEQNITRAAHVLGMSQPAVSNAVARLKVMFNDELFVRYGRGIQPTARAFQLFGSVRQALQLVQNELPGSGFEPASSERVFHLGVCLTGLVRQGEDYAHQQGRGAAATFMTPSIERCRGVTSCQKPARLVA